MTWVGAIAEFIGRVLRHVLPALIELARRPRRTKPLGNPQELQDAVDESIRDAIRAGAGRGGGDGVRDVPAGPGDSPPGRSDAGDGSAG